MDFFDKDDDGVEDYEFLCIVDAVENDAIKRRKIMKSPSNADNSSASNLIEEGKYTAALRGSKSHMWQQAHSRSTPNMSMDMNTQNKKEYAGGGIPFKVDENVPEKQCPCGAGLCIVLTSSTEKNPGRKFYKCPAREESGRCGFFEWCDAAPSPLGGYGVQNNNFNADIVRGSEPFMQCPCGAGPCSVLTAKTEKNMGRQFFKCPVKEESGRCGFFEWCDAAPSPLGGNGVQNNNFNADVAGGSEPFMQCPCGAGPCSLLTAKTEKNMGRQFFKCPVKQGEGSCTFFKWCDELNSVSNTSPVKAQNFSDRHDSTQSSSGRSGSAPCYRCGMDGHWARDCPQPSLSTVRSSSTVQGDRSTCFKCGQAGHWANNCSYQASGSGYSGAQTKASYNPGGRQGPRVHKSK